MCKVRGAYRDQPVKGLLTYGRNNPPTNTEVWKAETEPQTGETKQVTTFSPLETMLEFVFEVGTRRFRNSVLLRSFATIFETSGKRVFRYSYVLENLLENTVVVSWEVPGLPERIKADPELATVVRGTETGLAIELKGVVGIPLGHTHSPMFGTFPVYFFEPSGKRIAKGSAEAYIPSRR